jgi:hypothetical protein
VLRPEIEQYASSRLAGLTCGRGARFRLRCWRRANACSSPMGRRTPTPAHTHQGAQRRRRGVSVHMSQWPLSRTRAVRFGSHASCPNAVVYSCFLHGSCTNGLGDTRFVLQSCRGGVVPIGGPWYRLHSCERGGSPNDAIGHTTRSRTQTHTPRTCRRRTHTRRAYMRRTTAWCL